MWAISVAAILGLLVGETIRRLTGHLRYRRAPAVHATETPTGSARDEDERDLPSPGARWWMSLVSAPVWAAVAWRAGTDWRVYLLWLPFVAIGLYLAAVDLDVHRLPDRAQLLLATIALLAGLATTWPEPRRWFIALGCAAGVSLLFWLIHRIGRGALGFGDVKLAATCGWLLGLTGFGTVWAGLVLACLLAILYALVNRTKFVAFGPWLLLGTLIVGLWARTAI